jgi:leader peptidase (prepilin peptidase)/N-methyltransferase
MTPAAALALAVLIGLGLALSAPGILRRLPEPSPDEEDKIPYAALATGQFSVAVGTLGAAATALATLTLPVAVLPAWLVLGTLGLLLAAIDARTTWLPLPLTRLSWAAMAAAIGLGAVLGGWSQLLRGVGGFVLAGVVFGLVWVISRGGFGFGDVRYAPLVGAATATVSWTVFAWALVIGSLAGAVVGILRLALRRRGAFAYAPSILAGGYLAVAVARVTT